MTFDLVSLPIDDFYDSFILSSITTDECTSTHKMGKELCILVTVSLWDRIKIKCLSVVFGVWVICGMFVKWLWDSNAFLSLQQRDNPPPCLVDSFLGHHKYVKLKGVKFHYVEAGERSHPLVLLLHGFPDCWLSWRHQIPVLSNNFRVIALDLKGFGDSDKPASRHLYRFEKIIEELKALIATFGVTSCTVIGHDIGALLGWFLAHQFPEVIDKLIVISCPHPNECNVNFSSAGSRNVWMNFVQLPYFPEVDALKEDVKIITEYHKHLSQRDVMFLEAYKYAFSRMEDWSGALNYYRNLPYIAVSENVILQVPVILITGNKDKYVHLESIVKSTEFCEKFHMKVIDGTEHFPHQEKPDLFNEVLMKFLIKNRRNKSASKELEKVTPTTKGIMNMMLGVVSNSVKYGNSVLDSVQKKTNAVGIPSMGLLNYNPVVHVKTDSN